MWKMEETGAVYGLVEAFLVAVVKKAIDNMKNGKAGGPLG